MELICFYFIANIVIALVIFFAWDVIEQKVKLEDMYKEYGRTNTKIILIIVFLLLGFLMAVAGAIEAVKSKF